MLAEPGVIVSVETEVYELMVPGGQSAAAVRLDAKGSPLTIATVLEQGNLLQTVTTSLARILAEQSLDAANESAQIGSHPPAAVQFRRLSASDKSVPPHLWVMILGVVLAIFLNKVMWAVTVVLITTAVLAFVFRRCRPPRVRVPLIGCATCPAQTDVTSACAAAAAGFSHISAVIGDEFAIDNNHGNLMLHGAVRHAHVSSAT